MKTAPIPPLALAFVALLAGCSGPPEEEQIVNEKVVSEPAPVAEPSPVAAAAPAAEAGPTPAPSQTADDALALARRYYALVTSKDFAGAAALVRTGDARRLADKFGHYARLRATAGPAGGSEGAAGSIYITVPAWIEATDADGGVTTIEEIVTLRRVNDVPGSTEAQRRWHIEGVDAAATDDRGP